MNVTFMYKLFAIDYSRRAVYVIQNVLPTFFKNNFQKIQKIIYLDFKTLLVQIKKSSQTMKIFIQIIHNIIQKKIHFSCPLSFLSLTPHFHFTDLTLYLNIMAILQLVSYLNTVHFIKMMHGKINIMAILHDHHSFPCVFILFKFFLINIVELVF